MSGHRLSGPHRTYLFRSVVTNGKYEMQFRRTGTSEFIPTLAACFLDRNVTVFELVQCLWPNFSSWMTACAVSGEVGFAFVIQNSFSHYRTGGVPGTYK